MNISRIFSRVEEVNEDLLNVFLAPYKADCRYLKRAALQYPEHDEATGETSDKGLWFIKGDFEIPESCYIDDTGHFNSVEFNICYNQLFYILIAYLVQNQLLPEMRDWDLETYKRRQLSDFLITKFSSTFRKPVNSDAFQGMLSINKYAARSKLITIRTSCAFYDEHGFSEGDVTVCVVNYPSSQSPKAALKTSLSLLS